MSKSNKQTNTIVRQTSSKLHYEGASGGVKIHQDALQSSLLALEPRVMLDAAALVTGMEVSADAIAQEQAQEAINDSVDTSAVAPVQAPSNDDEILAALSSTQSSSDSQQLIFIDTSVENYQTLMEGIDSNAEVVFLNSEKDGVERIASVLETRSNIDAIHIISHGDSGKLFLGSAELNQSSMHNEHAEELQTIRQSLSDHGDILIYGCNFAAGDTGQQAAETLAQLTGADIAASEDLTGHESLDGDWDLELSTGLIEAETAITAEVADTWEHVLAPALPKAAIDITSFFNIGGNATVNADNSITLTTATNNQAGYAWSTTQLDFQEDLSINFSVYLGNNNNGADGIGFAFHNDPAGSSAQGNNGGGLGIGGLQNSIGIEFDTWFNGGPNSDLTNDHTSIVTPDNGGNSNHGTPITSVTDLGNIEDGAWHEVNLDWDASAQILTYTFDGVVIETLNRDIYNMDIGSNLAYFGFTASTGGCR